MAQQPAAQAAATSTEAAAAVPTSKKKLIVIVAVVLALVAAGGGVAFWMLKKPAPHAEKATQAEQAEQAEAGAEGDEEAHADPKLALTFVPFETFTVNLLPDPDDKFLQLDLTAEVKGIELADKLKAQMPAMRNRVLLLLTSKKASDIATPEGKAQLSAELLSELQKPLSKGGKPLNVTQVLFTSFVIQ